MTRPRLLIAAFASVSALTLAGSAGATARGSAEPLSAARAAAPVAAVPAAKPCKDGQPPVASLAPGDVTTDPDSITGSETLANIRKNKRLIVGTSGDVLLWGARNPESGKLEGYDIDLLNEIAARLDVPVDYKVINYAERMTKLADRSVDLVAHTMTINCARWQGSDKQPNAVNFSTQYYPAGQKVLVRSDSKARSIKDVKGKICVPAASTNVAHAEDEGVPAANLVQPPVIGDCLVKFQEGEVVAITGDDTVLAGFKAQDPYARVIGEAFSAEPYGLAINAGDPAFTRFVNAVLEDLRSDGTLGELYNRWMENAVDGEPPPIPPAVYGRNTRAMGRT